MILITGAARSGTSLTTRILQEHGCYLGNEKDINSLNENTAIRQNILKPYLSSVGADPMGQFPLPDTDHLPSQLGLRDKVLAHFKGGPEPYAYKDAKLTLVWPVWAEAFPDAKWVIVRRKAERIADSCIRTNFMKAHGTDKQGWLGWVREHERRFMAMKQKVNAIEVWPDAYIAAPNAFQPVAAFLGLKFDADIVNENVRPSAWHG